MNCSSAIDSPVLALSFKSCRKPAQHKEYLVSQCQKLAGNSCKNPDDNFGDFGKFFEQKMLVRHLVAAKLGSIQFNSIQFNSIQEFHKRLINHGPDKLAWDRWFHKVALDDLPKGL